MDRSTARHWAETIMAARAAGRLLEPITTRTSFSLDDAYAVQREVFALRASHGERRIGWKLGYTSEAMRRQMGVATPNFGPLTDVMLLPDGADVDPRLVQPRVEPEIGLILAADVTAGSDFSRVADAVGEARAVLEVVDSVWRDYRFQIEDNTADGSSAAQVVLGPVIARRAEEIRRLDRLAVSLTCDGAPVGSGTGAAAMGHPLAALAWLAAEAAHRGTLIRRGDLVITGGLTAAVPLEPAGAVRAAFGEKASVSVRRTSPLVPPREEAMHD